MIPIHYRQRLYILILIGLTWIGLVGFAPVRQELAPDPTPAPLTAARLVDLANMTRTASGQTPLSIDPALMHSAQSTAERSAGLAVSETGAQQAYGAGAIVWMAQASLVLPAGVDAEMLIAEWASGEGGIPILSPDYRQIGAGAAVSADGSAHYTIIAACTSSVTARAETSADALSAASGISPSSASSSVAAAGDPLVPITGGQRSSLLSRGGLLLPILASAAGVGLLLVFFALKS